MAYKHNTVEYGFGQMGSVFSDTTGAIEPPTDKVFVAITMLADTVFNSTNGLVADNNTENGLEYIGTGTLAHDAGSRSTTSGTGGDVIDNGNTFPKGITIYGRWTKITNNAATPIIAYIGD